ncbi:MAG: carbohydrate-binding protein [Capsulimonadaceae bacterium]
MPDADVWEAGLNYAMKCGSFSICALACAVFLAVMGASGTAKAAAVVTEHNDNARSGDNLEETVLTPANVNRAQFGKLFRYAVDDQSYSQPLIVPGLTMAADEKVHDVVFITTVNDSVYAFDADSGDANGGNPLWHDNFIPAGGRPPANTDLAAAGACDGDYTDFTGKMGIAGTPVIDTHTATLYVVSRDIDAAGTYEQKLHALDLTSGAEKFGGPVTISGSYNGVKFDPELNNQRIALTEIDGAVYAGWSSHCDLGPYHGWLMAYNALTLAPTAVWADTSGPAGSDGGIWMGGQGLTVDSTGGIDVITGNGSWDGVTNFGQSFVKLSPGLSVLDYFTPSDYSALNNNDVDLGAAGALAIPGTSMIIGGGKQGKVYLLNSHKMGHQGATDDVLQEFQATFPPPGDTGHIHGSPVYFDAGAARFIYLWGENDYLRAFELDGSTLNPTAVATSTMKAPVSGAGMPGGFLSVSANGTSNGILWASTPYTGDANHGSVPGILHAFNASKLSGGSLVELWNSEQDPARDSFGNFAKFTFPTVANGRVYVSTFGDQSNGSGSLEVYGELSGVEQPLTPADPVALAQNGANSVSWAASNAATSYNVFRGTTHAAEAPVPEATHVTGTVYIDSGLVNGATYFYRVAAVNEAGTSTLSTETAAAVPGVAACFGARPAVLPGTLPAADYDTGGSNVGYAAATSGANPGGQYRTDGVGIEACQDVRAGYNVGWTGPGQWLRYTVNVRSAGTYTVGFRVAARNAVADAFSLLSGGTNLTGPVAVPATGSFQIWTTVHETVTLAAGPQAIELSEDAGGWNLHWISFSRDNSRRSPKS